MGRKGKRTWKVDKLPIHTVVQRTRRRTKAGRKLVVRYIKVTNRSPKSKQWVRLSRWRWEQANGPVPKGFVVACLDGNSLNDSIWNLGLKTPGEVAQIQHAIDPIMSRRNVRLMRDATATRNRIERRCRIFGRDWRPTRWYAIDLNRGMIVAANARTRSELAIQIGLIDQPDVNGRRIPKLARSGGFSFLRGRDLACSSYRGLPISDFSRRPQSRGSKDERRHHQKEM